MAAQQPRRTLIPHGSLDALAESPLPMVEEHKISILEDSLRGGTHAASRTQTMSSTKRRTEVHSQLHGTESDKGPPIQGTPSQGIPNRSWTHVQKAYSPIVIPSLLNSGNITTVSPNSSINIKVNSNANVSTIINANISSNLNTIINTNMNLNMNINNDSYSINKRTYSPIKRTLGRSTSMSSLKYNRIRSADVDIFTLNPNRFGSPGVYENSLINTQYLTKNRQLLHKSSSISENINDSSYELVNKLFSPKKLNHITSTPDLFIEKNAASKSIQVLDTKLQPSTAQNNKIIEKNVTINQSEEKSNNPIKDQPIGISQKAQINVMKSSLPPISTISTTSIDTDDIPSRPSSSPTANTNNNSNMTITTTTNNNNNNNNNNSNNKNFKNKNTNNNGNNTISGISTKRPKTKTESNTYIPVFNKLIIELQPQTLTGQSCGLLMIKMYDMDMKPMILSDSDVIRTNDAISMDQNGYANITSLEDNGDGMFNVPKEKNKKPKLLLKLPFSDRYNVVSELKFLDSPFGIVRDMNLGLLLIWNLDGPGGVKSMKIKYLDKVLWTGKLLKTKNEKKNKDPLYSKAIFIWMSKSAKFRTAMKAQLYRSVSPVKSQDQKKSKSNGKSKKDRGKKKGGNKLSKNPYLQMINKNLLNSEGILVKDSIIIRILNAWSGGFDVGLNSLLLIDENGNIVRNFQIGEFNEFHPLQNSSSPFSTSFSINRAIEKLENFSRSTNDSNVSNMIKNSIITADDIKKQKKKYDVYGEEQMLNTVSEVYSNPATMALSDLDDYKSTEDDPALLHTTLNGCDSANGNYEENIKQENTYSSHEFQEEISEREVTRIIFDSLKVDTSTNWCTAMPRNPLKTPIGVKLIFSSPVKIQGMLLWNYCREGESYNGFSSPMNCSETRDIVVFADGEAVTRTITLKQYNEEFTLLDNANIIPLTVKCKCSPRFNNMGPDDPITMIVNQPSEVKFESMPISFIYAPSIFPNDVFCLQLKVCILSSYSDYESNKTANTKESRFAKVHLKAFELVEPNGKPINISLIKNLSLFPEGTFGVSHGWSFYIHSSCDEEFTSANYTYPGSVIGEINIEFTNIIPIGALRFKNNTINGIKDIYVYADSYLVYSGRLQPIECVQTIPFSSSSKLLSVCHDNIYIYDQKPQIRFTDSY